MYWYQCYGLSIASEIELPELVGTPARRGADVQIRRAGVAREPWDSQLGVPRLRSAARESAFHYAGVAAFAVRSGREVLVDADPDVDEDEIRPYLLGPMLAVLLHQRGLLVLHASSVVIDGGVVAFLGGPGWGKSTMAAILDRAGCPVVADDVTAVEVDSGTPRVCPGLPQIKLWPDTATELGHAVEALPRVHRHLDKRWQRVSHLPPAARYTVKHLYVLAQGAGPSIEPLPAREAVAELVRHSYVVELVGATHTAGLHLRQCARLAESLPVFRLARQRSLPALPELAALVARHATASDE